MNSPTHSGLELTFLICIIEQVLTRHTHTHIFAHADLHSHIPLPHQQRLLETRGCPEVRSLPMWPWIIDTALILVFLHHSPLTSSAAALPLIFMIGKWPSLSLSHIFPIDSTKVFNHYNYLIVHINWHICQWSLPRDWSNTQKRLWQCEPQISSDTSGTDISTRTPLRGWHSFLTVNVLLTIQLMSGDVTYCCSWRHYCGQIMLLCPVFLLQEFTGDFRVHKACPSLYKEYISKQYKIQGMNCCFFMLKFCSCVWKKSDCSCSAAGSGSWLRRLKACDSQILSLSIFCKCVLKCWKAQACCTAVFVAHLWGCSSSVFIHV